MKKTVTLHPSRIGCPSIPATMRGIIVSIDGVIDINIRHEDRSLDVTFDTDKVRRCKEITYTSSVHLAFIYNSLFMCIILVVALLRLRFYTQIISYI